MQLFFIHDKISGDIKLFLSEDCVRAKRSFVSFMMDDNSLLSAYPDDYDLHYFPVFGLTYDGDSTDLEICADDLLLKCPILLSGTEAHSAADSIKQRRNGMRVGRSTTADVEDVREAEKKE